MPDLSTLLDPFKMGEDLPAQLEMVQRLAPQHCVSCDGYHLAWAERRAKQDRDTELFHNPELTVGILAAIGRLHGAGHRSVKMFVAGSGDTKLLAACAYAAHVQKYFEPDAVEFHVMDACETPLLLLRAYAEQFGLRLNTTRAPCQTRYRLCPQTLFSSPEFSALFRMRRKDCSWSACGLFCRMAAP